MVDDSAGITDEDWKSIFYYISKSSVIPFLGAGIAKVHFGTGADLAKVITEEFGYPIHDTSNLGKVTQYAVENKIPI